MKITRGYKVELDLNNKQITACLKHAGCARFAFNWGLASKKQAYQLGQKIPTAIDLHKELNALKATDYPWMYEVSKCAPQEALRDLDVAYKNAYRRSGEKKAGKKVKVGWPRFKSRNKGIGGFRLTGSIHIYKKTIQLPRLGKLRLKEQNYLPVGAKVAQATVTERAGRWYVSVQIEQEIGALPAGQDAPMGIDLGIKALATCSDGTSYANPKALRTRLKQLRRASKRVSSKKKGGKNRAKARKKLARVHAKIANLRKDTLQKTTTAMVTKATSNGQRASCIVIEDLNISGMLKNRRLSKAIAGVGLYEFRRQLTYKLEAAGIPLKVVSRWYPSSKTCSCCGWVNENLTLADRTFICQECGLVLDRDVNAARNLARAAYELFGLPPVRRECTALDIVSDLGNKATVDERATEHG
jgi:putative transposase